MKSEAIVDRINDQVNALPKNIYDRPQQKFIREFLSGILISKSTILTEITRSLSSGNNDFKKNYKRLNRRLDEVDLEPAFEQQQNRAFAEITKDTIIAIDLGDITKPAAKKMEALSLVADGSDNHKIKPGYGLLGAVAINPSSQDKTPQPLELMMYSPESSQFVSENAMLKEFISNLHIRTNGLGTDVIDRGGDRSILLKHYFELNRDFIIRLKGRHLIGDDGETIAVGKNRNVHFDNLPFDGTIQRESPMHDRKRQKMFVRYDFETVKVKNLMRKGEPSKVCTLVTAWNPESKRPIELITSKVITNCQEALQILVEYLSRWSVEETYRFLKVSSGLEEMRLFSFDKLRNLCRAVFLACSIIARMTRVESWKKVFERTALRLKKAPDALYNWLYRAADACSVLVSEHLSKILKFNRPKLEKRRPRGYFQPSLFPFEIDL